MTCEEYPYLAQLSVPDRLRLAAYVAGDQGVPSIHLRAILDAAEGLENGGLGVNPSVGQPEALKGIESPRPS